MIEENKRKEKMCLFFASDYHFEMISLPYISKNLDKKIIIVTENNLEKTVEKVLSRTNLSDEKRNEITKIDWKNNELSKFREIKSAKEQNKEAIIFVKGREDYIYNINKNIENWTDTKKVKIIDCYDINEVHDDVNMIAGKYEQMLSTSGIEKLLKKKNINTCQF